MVKVNPHKSSEAFPGDVSGDYGGGGGAPFIMVDQTGDRELDTVYQNTTGHPINITVYFESRAFDTTPGNNAEGTAKLKVDNFDPPTTIIGEFKNRQETGSSSLVMVGLITYVIPDNYFYRISTTIAGDASYVVVAFWYEMEMY